MQIAHPERHRLGRRLRRAGAPTDLVQWIDSLPLDDDPWQQCDRGDWLIWLAALAGAPVVALVDAAVASARRALKVVKKGRAPLKKAIRAARDRVSADACGGAAEACEMLGPHGRGDDYRSTAAPSYESAAAAAAHVARAAEALLVADAHLAAENMRDADERGAVLGVGSQSTMGPRRQSPTLELGASGPGAEALSFAVDACAQAALEACEALLPEIPSERERERIEAALSEIVFDALDPIYEALQSGHDVDGLVSPISVRKPTAEEREQDDDPEQAEETSLTLRTRRIAQAFLFLLAVAVLWALSGLGEHC